MATIRQTGNLPLHYPAMLAALIVSLSFAQVSAEPSTSAVAGYTSKTKQTTALFATTATLSIYDDFTIPERVSAFEDCWSEVKALLSEIEQAVSLSVADSDISRFNALAFGESLPISLHTARILQIAKNAYDMTGGFFDPTVMPLVDLWGFTPRFNTNNYQKTQPYDRDFTEKGLELPDAKYIQGLLPLVDFSGVTLSGDETSGYTMTKNIPSVTIDGIVYQAKLDLGGVAKGYSVDLVILLLRERGYVYGYFSNGGSSMAVMQNASADSIKDGSYAYRIGVRKPRPGESEKTGYTSFLLSDRALSTSGDYDHSYQIDGVIYCHLIDPNTGYPINMPTDGQQKGIATVTVFLDSAAMGDCLSTALCVLPLERSIDFINEHLKSATVTMVLYNHALTSYEVISNVHPEDISLSDARYVLASHLSDTGDIVYTGSLLK